MYSGFEGYRTPSADDFAGVLRTGLIVLDANVLLNLYRYRVEARDDLLSVMRQLDGRLFIPHQVVKEFWRNREGVLRDPRDTRKTSSELAKQRQETVRSLRTWFNRVYLPEGEAQEVVSSVNALFDDLEARVDALSVATSTEWARDTAKDDVLRELEPILRGRVGPSLNEPDYGVAVVEGLRRVDQQIPPGYRDKKKDDAGAAGDYLVWEQSLLEAQSRDCDLLIVTGDVKEDWWREESGERRGPRLELAQECLARTGRSLFMLRPTQLLDYARAALSVSVRDESVEDAKRVDEIANEEGERPEYGGWTPEGVSKLVDWLASSAPVQANVLIEACQGGGFVSRDRVYELGEYSEDRSLRGFTRPINRIAQLLRDSGAIDSNAVDPLWAVYNADSPASGWAAGFRIHIDTLPLFVAAHGRRQFTWLQAAEAVMSGSDRDWTVDELVREIEAQGLRDLRGAATPGATLRRDLATRGQDAFEQVGPSTFRLIK